ncbi:MAG: DUF2255 family protein [Rhodococcus sp. (in: high G+C Gram-positive bacteria)]|uniref:DUF2255 family protein n=1 Tax=Rhodococcus sp. TaxID=1831 RepID=UPI003BB63AF8
MSTWNENDRRSLERVGEIRVAGRRRDGTVRTPVIVWHVVVDGDVYVRSVRGSDGQWYRGVLRSLEGTISWDGTTRDVTYIPDDSADDAVDVAYAAKYGESSATRSITSLDARATTLRVEPR